MGHGIYFWENNPERALQFAGEHQRNPRAGKPAIEKPFVIGAIIDPGQCLNLMESRSLRLLRQAFEHLREISRKSDTALPVNRVDKATGEVLQRYLDCAVIETLHGLNEVNEAPAYDTVRGVFEEGPALYPNSGFREKNHIQICVRNNACIRGYFRPLPQD